MVFPFFNKSEFHGVEVNGNTKDNYLSYDKENFFLATIGFSTGSSGLNDLYDSKNRNVLTFSCVKFRPNFYDK